MKKTMLYKDGLPVKGAGAHFPSEKPAPASPEKSIAITVAEAKQAMAGGGNWDAEGAVLIGNLQVEDSVTVCNLTVHGQLRILAENVVLQNVRVLSDGTALTVEAAGLSVKNCCLEGKIAIQNAGNDLHVVNSVLVFSAAGIQDDASAGTAIRNCRLEGQGTAIQTAAESAQVLYCTIVVGEKDCGIVMGSSRNQIAAMNCVRGAQEGIRMEGSRNSVLLRNSVISVTVKNNHAVYICENAMGGRLTATDNNYLLADCNRYPEDGMDHSVVSIGNRNMNGNTLMDVDARLKVGADEALLPHVDKELFVGMPRRTTVCDPSGKSELTLPQYVNTHALTEEIVIIPPGAYCSDEMWSFPAAASDTTVYAYGVYAERQKDLRMHAYFRGARNVMLKGIQFAFRQQSCGQAYVLEKLPDMAEDGKSGWVRIVTAAGMMNEFGNTNPAYFNTTGMGAQRAGTFYAYCDTGFWKIEAPEEDGTRLMQVAADVYKRLEIGDILTCRACNGHTTMAVEGGCENIAFYDLTMYGGAAGFAWVEHDNKTATTYYRVLNTTRTGELITEEEYDRYRALEKKYGVSLEISRDELGRFRGSPAHIGSIDATHTTRCAQGSICISCLFENMCDDGTNQNHTHGRLADVTDNKDGTTTITYKGNLSHYAHQVGSRTANGFCADFRTGERVYVYTAGGQLVCDTPALSPTEHVGKAVAPEYNTEYEIRKVKVATDAVNFRALDGYDLSINLFDSDKKVLIDNMSKASNGFIFDNVMVRNIRSRGLLIKASDAKIVNCSFYNIGMSCAAILYEIYWGESGVTENLEVSRNLFDHTGYFRNIDHYAPIAIEGLGSRVDEDYLLYKNILITDNVIRNRTTDYAVYVNSAKGVVIRNNDFGTVNEIGNHFKTDIHLNGAMNIEISDNMYSDPTATRTEAIRGEHIRNIYGTDVMVNGKSLLPDAE